MSSNRTVTDEDILNGFASLHQAIAMSLATIQEQFAAVDRRFETMQHDINRRFDAIDVRLDAMDRRFDAIDVRLDAMDRRFDAMDRRFDAMDARLDAMDRRFDAMDARFDAMDRRFDAMDARFDAMDREFLGVRNDTAKLEDRVMRRLTKLEAERA